MIYLELFLTFFEIGAVSFGGGYGMLSLIRELTIAKGWLTEGQLLNFVAVSESTPGPIAINMATFIGSSQGGVFGSFCATLGVVLPSFIIILIVAALMLFLLWRAAVRGILSGPPPCSAD
ncbi:MAG: chromate transporter, partial [Clostridia bacterium]|nr:chromate transporter [Clostridia bacterium]